MLIATATANFITFVICVIGWVVTLNVTEKRFTQYHQNLPPAQAADALFFYLCATIGVWIFICFALGAA